MKCYVYIAYCAGALMYYCNAMAIDYSTCISIKEVGFMSAHDCAKTGIDYCAVMSRDSIDR